ncbi:hypothetical protein OYE22_17375 [Streptomyces sp. 71268]|uniref:hypothetical protein n=1 Tax=Streptomyces sp. 71268 TaxID=3002640 RepID=UPI0023F73D15|nr:hypothetical protein [Streptomyces sp. 71268]WEV26773.1 hypothetical protein OYE22_17375 [Streptomyces sp. 71268]
MSPEHDTTPDEPPSTTPPSCFVIGPIGDKHAEHGTPERRLYEESMRVYEEVIVAACREHHMTPVRADSLTDTGEVTEQIYRRLEQDDIVIADVSGGNPNVTLELGYRLGCKRTAILIGETGNLPFNIRQLRTVRFRRTEVGLPEARDQLSRFLAAGVARGFGPVADLGAAPQPLGHGVGEASDEEPDAPGLVDRVAQAEEQMEAVLVDIEAMGEALRQIAEVAYESTPQMDAVTAANGSTGARLAVVGSFARKLTKPATALRESSEAFAARMTDIEAGIHAAFDIAESHPGGEIDADNENFLHQIIDMAESTRAAATEVTEFGTMMKTFIGYSRTLRGPGGDILTAVRVIASVLTRVNSLEARARALLPDPPAPLATTSQPNR